MVQGRLICGGKGGGHTPRPIYYQTKEKGVYTKKEAVTGFGISLGGLARGIDLSIICAPGKLRRVGIRVTRIGHPNLFLTKCCSCFSGLQLRVLNLTRVGFLSNLSTRGQCRQLSRLFDRRPPTIVIYHDRRLRPFPRVLRLTRGRKITLLHSGRVAYALVNDLVDILGLRLTPHVAHRNILIRICNRKVLVLNSDNVNGDRLTVRLIGHNRHLITSSTIRLHGISGHRVVNATPRGVHRFVRLHNVNVIGITHIFNMNTIGRDRDLSLIIRLRT